MSPRADHAAKADKPEPDPTSAEATHGINEVNTGHVGILNSHSGHLLWTGMLPWKQDIPLLNINGYLKKELLWSVILIRNFFNISFIRRNILQKHHELYE